MGSFLSSLRDLSWFDNLFSGDEEMRILLVGLDASGKTTAVYYLKLNESLNTLPTIGFNVEQVKYKNLTMTLWDIGGQSRIRPLWKHYYPGTHAIIYMVDSNDKDRVDESRTELKHLLEQHELSGCPLLVFANKQDLPQALSVSQLSERLGMNDVRDREWWIQASSAITGDGLYEGMNWLATALQKRK